MATTKRSNPALVPGALAALVLEKAAPGEEVSLDRLESELNEAPRYDIVATLMALDKAGAGKFVAGRQGRKAQFVWAGKAAVAAVRASLTAGRAKRAAMPERGPAVPPVRALDKAKRRAAESSSTAAPRMLDHAFHVRPGVVVSWRLPEDVTPAEIERLCQFLQTLPFR
jgi:hypothetical protein